MPRRRKKSILIRQCLFFLGILLLIATPFVGILPGPGGVFVFAAGLALILQNSEWAKRLYVKFKRRHPNKGRWADWGLRRLSARRREEQLKRAQTEAAEAEASPGAPEPAPAPPPLSPRPARRHHAPPETRKPVRERRWWQ